MKNLILTKVILFIAITLISSCKNKDELYLFEARGRVTNKVTSEPLEGVKITLKNGAAGSLLGWSSPLLIGLFDFCCCKYTKTIHIFALQGTNDRRILNRCL